MLWLCHDDGASVRRVCVGQIIGRSSLEVNDEAVH